MMKLLTRYILLLFTACSLLISSCGKHSNNKEKVTPQTIIVYLSGTSLDWAFNINVQDIETALQQNIKGDSRVVVVWQNGVAKKAEAIELCYDNGHITRQPLAEYDLSNTMSKDDLSYIFNDVMRLAPASAYGLILGSHSWAWIPFDDYDQIRSNGLSKSAYARLRIMEELPRHLPIRMVPTVSTSRHLQRLFRLRVNSSSISSSMPALWQMWRRHTSCATARSISSVRLARLWVTDSPTPRLCPIC